MAEHADAVYTGDGEALWAQVVADAHEGRLRPRYDGTSRGSPAGRFPPPRPVCRKEIPAGEPAPVWSRLSFHTASSARSASTSVTAIITRPVAEVVAEIAAQPRRDLFFVDDNFVSNPEAAKELLRALIPLKIRWVSQASVEHTRDPELMRLFVESGCMGNVIGFESLNIENLRQMRKAANLAAFDGYAEAVATLRDHHLQTWSAFALGYDHDTVESILQPASGGLPTTSPSRPSMC